MGYTADSVFHAFHIQSPVMDILFLSLLVGSILYTIVVLPNCSCIFKRISRNEAYFAGINSSIKTGVVLWSKGLILLSIPVSLASLQSYYDFPDDLAFFAVVLAFSIMLFRHVSVVLMFVVLERRKELKMIKRTFDSHLVIFAMVFALMVLLSYSSTVLPCLPYFFAMAFIIIHVIRMVKVLFVLEISFLDIFLYLCTFDLLPLVIAIFSIMKIIG